ncbi:unnamed protein product [Porites evermanni]|uniref:Uncharacterized protein n=1 Tax=Porites evermanni TaxID=104178 RepID=A0ABN8SS27_9CNID|nr:unnamed protein product [Porites evermanni]
MITSRKQKLLHCFCLIVSVVIIAHQYFNYKHPTTRSYHSDVSTYRMPRDDESFLSDWCRLQRSRVDWEGLVSSCRRKMAWKDRELNPTNRTDAKKSFISRLEIKPQGEFSRFFIQSVTSDGNLKRTGGDSWRVYIRRGPASLAPMVTDNDDGTYEVMFLALEPGNYSAQVFLDYTLCEGFRDPPEDWFIRGNIHGYEQEHGILGDISIDYINSPLQSGKSVNIYIKESNKTNGFYSYNQRLRKGSGDTSLSKLSCNVDCSLLWDGFGRWIKRKWNLYIPEEDLTKRYHYQAKSKRLQTLCVYGDSMGVHYHKLAKSRPLCKEMFLECNNKYMWIYDAEWRGDDGNDFNQTIILEEIKQILTRPEMTGNHSVFFFNVGIHYSLVLNFTTYRRLIQSLITLLKRDSLGSKALQIWRSSTAIEREHLKKLYAGDNLTKWRFHTSPRVQLFNKFATWEMCMAGIPVLDIYPLTATWPHGTRDHIHYSDDVIEPAVLALERFLSERFQQLCLL